MSSRAELCIAIACLSATPLACASDGGRAAPAGPEGGGSLQSGPGKMPRGEGGDPNAAAQGGAAHAGAGDGDAGEDGIGHLGGLGPVNGGGGTEAADALCAVRWGNAEPLAGITSAADESLLTMTHDERSLVLFRDDQLLIADRESAEVAFDAPLPFALPQGYTHTRGLALSPDGLRLVIASDDGAVLAEITRASRQGGFGSEPSAERYSALNYHAGQFGASLSSPVLAKSDRSLYYVRHIGDESLSFHAVGDTSFRVPDAAEDKVTLGGVDGTTKRTQSISADERAIFIFDEALGHAVGLWNVAPGAPFTHATQFSGLHSVFTNDDCSRLYGTREVAGALDIVVETPD